MAEMPLFPLAPWELPPDCDEPLEAPATSVHISAQGVKFWIRRVETVRGTRLFFREAACQEVGNWVWPRHIEWFGHFDIELQFEQHRFTDFARYFCFDGAAYGHAGFKELVIGPQEGAWLAPSDFAMFVHSPYGWPEFYSLRSAQVGQIAKGWLYNSHWPARFALNWTNATDLERQSQVLSVTPENLALLKTLLLHVLRSEKWESESRMVSWRIKEQPEKYKLDNEDNVSDSFLLIEGRELWTSIRLRKWKNALWTHFNLSIERGSQGVIRQVIPQFWHYTCLEIEVHFPTAHEILESQLTLREWVQSIGSPPHFQQLLALDEE